MIPANLIILALLANGTGRRVINRFILGIVGIEIGANGYHFKLINFILFSNLASVFAALAKIHRINHLHSKLILEDNHHVDPSYSVSYMTELNLTYRNMLMHICSMVLIFCLNVATE